MSEVASQPTSTSDATAPKNAEAGAAPEASIESSAPVEQPNEPRRLKLKVDGEEISLTEEEAIRYAQLGKTSTQRLQEASRLRSEAEELVKNFKGSAREALKDPEIRKAFEDAYAAEVELEMMSPEERALREKDAELERYRDDERRRKEQEEAAELSRVEQQYAADYERQFVAALQSANLPKTPATIRKMAEYMGRALNAGVEVTAADVVGFVRDDYVRDIKETLGGLDEATLFNLLGDDVAGKIRKADLARVKGSQQFGKPQIEPKPKPQQTGPKDLDDFLENL